LSSIKKNFIYNTILAVTQVVFPLIIFPYVSRILGAQGIGKVSFVESICRYLMLLAALGIPIYGVREVSKVRNNNYELNKLVSEILYIHLFATFLIIFLFSFLLYNLSIFQKDIPFYLIGLIFIFSNVFNVEWVFQGLEEFKFIAVRSILIKILINGSVFFLIKNMQDSFLYFILIVATLIINSIINFFYLFQKVQLEIAQFRNLKKHLIPLLYIFSSTAFISVYTLSDTILLGAFSSEKAVGIYTIGQKLARLPIIFIGGLSIVLIPKISNYHYKGERSSISKILQDSYEFVIILSLPIIFYLIGNADLIINVFAGKEFLNSADILKILSVLVLLIGLSNIFGLQILTPLGKDKYFTLSVFFGMIVSIILNVILIPRIDEYGAALSSVISETIVTLVTFYYSSKFFSFNNMFIFFFQNFILHYTNAFVILLCK